MIVKISENWAVNTANINEIFIPNDGEDCSICVNFSNGDSSDKEFDSNEEAWKAFNQFFAAIGVSPVANFTNPNYLVTEETEYDHF